jgi:EpsI family protein
MVLVASFAAWRVYAVRAELSRDDADPAAVARLEQRLSRIPDRIEGYAGVPEPIDARTARMAGADTFASMRYSAPDTPSFHLYVAGAIRNQENFHAPSYCMPAAGWELLEQSTVPFAFGVSDQDARMRRLLLQRGSDRMLVYYWFQAGGVLADHEWTVRYYRFLDLLAGRPLSPTLIVTVYASVPVSVSETERSLRSFLATVGPSLHRAIQEDS